MKLIVGLGNIGREYENTRHNIGFMVVDELARRLGVSFGKEDRSAYMAEYRAPEKILIIKPTTYMNLSGNCLRDYLTHRPVIVMPQARGYRLFGLENTPLRPIFADTAGGRQMMLCLTPEATILDNGQTKRAVEALLALSPGLGGNAPALLPASLLEDGQEGV